MATPNALLELINAARLSPALNKIRETSAAIKAAAAPVAKRMEYADVPPGKEFPGLNRVETADLANQVQDYKANFGVDKIEIPRFSGPRKDNWQPIYQTVKRNNENSWWGTTTGDVRYDQIANDDAYRAKHELEVDVIKMTPQDYINIAGDLPRKGAKVDDILARETITGNPQAYEQAVINAQPDINGVGDRMIAEGNSNIPVLDYTKSHRDGLLRAYAAKSLGIREMPVMVVRSSAPAETIVSKAEDGSYYVQSVREGTAGAQPHDKFGFIETNFDPEKNRIEIQYSKLAPQYQGRGLGLDMYKTLIRRAFKDGHTMASDNTLSPESYRVWQSLAKQGYRIKKNPTTREVNIGNETGYHTADLEPVFTVLAEPKVAEKPIKIKPKAKPVKLTKEMVMEQVRRMNLANAQRLQAQQRVEQAALPPTPTPEIKPPVEAPIALKSDVSLDFKMHTPGVWVSGDYSIERVGQGKYNLFTPDGNKIEVDSLAKAKEAAADYKPTMQQPSQPQQARDKRQVFDQYEIIDIKTGQRVGDTYTSRGRARARADKLDEEYGAVRYVLRPVMHGVENAPR